VEGKDIYLFLKQSIQTHKTLYLQEKSGIFTYPLYLLLSYKNGNFYLQLEVF